MEIKINCNDCNEEICDKDKDFIIMSCYYYHRNCFKCKFCKEDVFKFYHLQSGILLCSQHYMKFYNNSCKICNKRINGPMMRVGECCFHSECFQCVRCNSFIDFNQNHVLVDNSKLLCISCLEILYPFYDYKPTVVIPHRLHILFVFCIYLRNIYGITSPSFKIKIGPGKKYLLPKYKDYSILKNKNKRVSIDLAESIYVKSCFPSNVAAKNHSFIFHGDLIISFNHEKINYKRDKKRFQKLFTSTQTLLDSIIYIRQISSNNDIDFKSRASMPISSYVDHLDDQRKYSMNHKNMVKTFSNEINEIESTNRKSASFNPVRCYSVEDVDKSNLNYSGFTRTQSALIKFQENVFTGKDITILETLGEGFFGVALKVFINQTNEIMVMKRLKKTTQETSSMFREEVQLMKSLKHHNLVKFLGVFVRKEGIDVLIEFISGGTLKKTIKKVALKELMFTNAIIFEMALDIASGMAYLHSKNIAHRDLTSKNCLIRDLVSFSIVISDFGLSRVIRKDNTDKLDVVGSPYWMAPEMLHGKSYDLSIDVFSSGIILCEITSLKSAHPDKLKRKDDFSLDEESYLKDVEGTISPPFISKLAIKCCNMIPSKRPIFSGIVSILRKKIDDNNAVLNLKQIPLKQNSLEIDHFEAPVLVNNIKEEKITSLPCINTTKETFL